MKLKFFVSNPKGSQPASPSISVRAKGAVALSAAATTTISAEHGEAATICYDEESERWMLAHWPSGQAEQPMLRALSGNSKGLRFQCTAAAQALFAALPVALRENTSISCPLNPEPITSEDAPGASFYVLTLPEAGSEQESSPKQPGVGRGKYDRSKANRKGVERG
jgi:hypothetical protein